MNELYSDVCQSPIGEIYVVSQGEHLCFLGFYDNPKRIDKLLKKRFSDGRFTPKENVLDMRDRLQQYFNKNWQAFKGLKLKTMGTPFQETVWRALQEIPAGQVASYFDVATSVGNEKASRAVGNSNGNNPMAIVIPCHRVIAKNHDLAGYGDGVHRKQWLLEHEGVTDFR